MYIYLNIFKFNVYLWYYNLCVVFRIMFIYQCSRSKKLQKFAEVALFAKATQTCSIFMQKMLTMKIN